MVPDLLMPVVNLRVCGSHSHDRWTRRRPGSRCWCVASAGHARLLQEVRSV